MTVWKDHPVLFRLPMLRPNGPAILIFPGHLLTLVLFRMIASALLPQRNVNSLLSSGKKRDEHVLSSAKH
jgi:hypothetical protein